MYHRLSSFAEIFTPLSKIIERYIYIIMLATNDNVVFSCDYKKIPKDVKVTIVIYTL